MDYLDYLADHRYDELPPAVRDQISREEYDAHRELSQQLSTGQSSALPGPALLAAFSNATNVAPLPIKGGTSLALAQVQGKGEGQRKERTSIWPFVAAAGWLLFLLAGGLYVSRPTELVELAAVVPPPVIRTDTVRIAQTDTLYLPKYKYVTRIVRDTVYRPSSEPIYVTVRDTVYRAAPPAEVYRVSGSKNLEGREELLRLMISAE
ncbi:hypothetical protein [Lewinella sp. 4G2]|uniref:hypothetical protein n=1 Tax=Lewinella sp. 4G2 TaxID=1803372 RepID=UPI0007B4E841|nr:hypothetical protein [Lewinella sp. 4G2]OAV45170.1 hypothetical protein A3850_012005 [Lewinella sp. 4G2]